MFLRTIGKPRTAMLVAMLLSVPALALADSSRTLVRSSVKIAEGVYTIRHKDAPDTFPQGNTTVIIGERDVLVVDSCYLPSAAREDIAQIRQWTNKPVRYLVNTHWHVDHTMGNGSYWAAFPGISIVAHTQTAKQSIGYNPGWFERYPRRADRLRKILEDGKDNNGKVLTAGEREEYKIAIDGLAPVHREYLTIEDRTPTVTFESELRIDLGGREVRIMHLGRGNTAGDAVVYLPKEKILIAGDLVVHPIPYLFSGYPTEYAQTLGRMSRMEQAILVPGHGEVLLNGAAGKYTALLIAFISDVTQKVSDETHRLGGGTANLDAVRAAVNKSVNAAAWRKKFAGDAADEMDFFDSTLAGLITAAHAEISSR